MEGGTVAGNWYFFSVWLDVTAILVDVRHTDAWPLTPKARRLTPNARVPNTDAQRQTPNT